MLTRGSADSLSRIRVSTDAMEMEMAMTADGAVVHGGPMVRRVCDSCRCRRWWLAGRRWWRADVSMVVREEEELAVAVVVRRSCCNGGGDCVEALRRRFAQM